MLKILICEDDAPLAMTLRDLVEDNPRYRVVGIAEDLDEAVAQAGRYAPDLALIDLHLAHGSTGYSVAVRLGDLGVPCLFVTGTPPAFPLPDLALGCLAKPFTADEIHRSLRMAEDVMRGREQLRLRTPRNFELYDEPTAPSPLPTGGFIPSRRSLRTRIGHWIGGAHRH